MLDQPVADPERDALRRSALARAIYELIAFGLPGEPLRIGVYGDWGEGKSTVLKFIEYFCRQAEIPVIWFNPWAAKDTAGLWRSFSRQVRAELRARRSLREFAVESSVRVTGLAGWSLSLAAKWYPWITALLPLQKAADAAARSLDRRALDQGSVDRFLHKLPPDRRLVVIIDDLDRADPEIVPHLLLALREVFDVGGCAFVLALDPRILAKAFPVVHPGWGTTGEFIDKIIQFPFWLPPATTPDLLRLANDSLDELSVSVDRAAVRELIDLVPKNPRRLKQYFRSIMKLRAAIERHDPDELKWSVLLLLELMRAISPLVASELFRSDSFVKLLSRSTMTRRDEKDEYTRKVRQELEAEVRTAYERSGSESQGQEALQRVIAAFGERVGIIAEEGVRYWARLDDDPPIFTWREFRRLIRDWRTDNTADILRKLVDEHAQRRAVVVDAVLRDVFRTAIQYRGELLDRAADVALAEEQSIVLREADEALRLIEQLAFALPGFSDRFVFGVEEFHVFYEHVAHWAHFTNTGEYRRIREAEKNLLLRIAANAERFAADELDTLQVWMPFRFGGGRPEAEELFRELVNVLSRFVIVDLRGRFIRENGIGSLWGQNRALTQKYFLFRLDSGFYTGEGLEYLSRAAADAATSQAIQENFLEFLRLLTYGITNTLGVVTQEELLPLARNREIVGLAWRAATTHGLQPRTRGSLEESRQSLTKVAGSEEHLALPHWWRTADRGVATDRSEQRPAVE